mgnify:CR=1 FL=1
MPTGSEFLNDNPKSSFLFCGNFGEGKTSVAITFHKIFYIGFRQGGLSVLKKPGNERYQKNLIHYEELCPKSDEELKAMFMPDGKKGLIYQYITKAKQMAEKGEVETLVVDDSSDWSNNMVKYIWTFEPKVVNGAPDTQSMYGTLARYQSNILDQDLLTFRRYGNFIMTTHLMRESEQTIEGTKTRAGAVDKMSNLLPDIVGGLRREMQRKFENVIYLEAKLQSDGKTKKYIGYTEKQVAIGTVIQCKNVLGLSPIIENPSYETLFNQPKGGK